MAKSDKAARREHWRAEPQEHDFPAAADFLSLLFGEADCTAIVEALRAAPTMQRKAKDLLRAAGLPLLSERDAEVRKDLKKVAAGTALSPVLLVRGRAGAPLIVADGYHRICASYHLAEDAEVRCRLVDAP